MARGNKMKPTNWIDLHVHIGPDILQRKYSMESIAKEERGKIAGMALKSHAFPTPNNAVDNPVLVPSVVLNNFVGGLNPEAVFALRRASEGPIIVWFPTVHARNHLEKTGCEVPKEWSQEQTTIQKNVNGIAVLDRRGRLSSESKDVLEAIKETRAILATGHLSFQETEIVVQNAKQIGIQNVIITHPIYQHIAMPIALQRKLSLMQGVFIEHTYAMFLIDKITIMNIVRQMREIGPEKCILSSDMGQTGNPSPSEGLLDFAHRLMAEGITEAEIELMLDKNPREIIRS
jgi:hypothetical protein